MAHNDIIRKIGRVLYGENWMRPLSRDLGCNERQVRRWANNEAQARKKTAEAAIKLALDRELDVRATIQQCVALLK